MNRKQRKRRSDIQSFSVQSEIDRLAEMINRAFAISLVILVVVAAQNTCHSHATKEDPLIDWKTTIHCDFVYKNRFSLIFRLHNNFCLAPFVWQTPFTLTRPSLARSLLFLNNSILHRDSASLFPILFSIKAFNYWKHLFWIFQLNVSLFIFRSFLSLALCFDSVEINRLYAICFIHFRLFTQTALINRNKCWWILWSLNSYAT